MVTRRSFLGGIIALTAAAAVPENLWSSYPVLWGDGVHDDTRALQALFDRNPVYFALDQKAIRPAGKIELQGGRYRITETLTIRSNTVLLDVYFDSSIAPVVVTFPGADHIYIANSSFTTPVNGPFFIFSKGA